MPRKEQVKRTKGRGSANIAAKKETLLERRIIGVSGGETGSLGTTEKDSSTIVNKGIHENKISSYFPVSPESKKGLLSATESEQTSKYVEATQKITVKMDNRSRTQGESSSSKSTSSLEEVSEKIETNSRTGFSKQTPNAIEQQVLSNTTQVQGRLSKEGSYKELREEFPSKDLEHDHKDEKVESETLKETSEKNTESTKQSFDSPVLNWPSRQKTSAKGRRKGKSKTESKTRQTEVSDYFAVRRSNRKCKSELEDEKRRKVEDALLSGKEEDLEVQQVEGKGRGVFARRHFSRGEFVCEYAGELIEYSTAKEREKFYEGKTEFGCYMYYFTFKNKKLCVDATKESGRLGRLLNHSRSEANCATRLTSIKDRPYLILETIKDVKEGEELLYDYGERSKDIIQSHPWLKA